MGVLFVVLLVLGLALAGYFAYQKSKQEEARRLTLLQWATNNSWRFDVEDDQWCERWQRAPFGEGDHRRARNIVQGQWKGTAFRSFDYTYQTHTSDGRGNRTTTTHHYAVCSLQLPTQLPTLQVTPENLFTRFGNALGVTDIELESEDFNRAFRVHARDPKFASDVLSARTMQMLLAAPHVSWRIDGADLLCWDDGETTPASIVAMLATLAQIVGGIPQFVWHDNGYDAGSASVGGSA